MLTEKALLDALAVAILGSDYNDHCHERTYQWWRINSHIKTPPEFVKWAKDRMGKNYDPTCQAPVGDVIKCTTKRESDMSMSWVLTFFVMAIVCAVFGFTGIAIAVAEVAKILFVVFFVLFVMSLVLALLRRP